MQSGPVPPSLSELFLPDPSGDQSGANDQAGSAAEADRFERYLRSARQSVATGQALPTMARSERSAAEARRDLARRDEVDRSERPAAPRSKPAERSTVTDRRDDHPERAERTAHRDDRDDRTVDGRNERSERPRPDDDRRVEVAGSDGERSASVDDEGADVAAGSTGSAAADGSAEGAGGQPTIDGDAAADLSLSSGDALVEGAETDPATESGPGTDLGVEPDGARLDGEHADDETEQTDEVDAAETGPAAATAHLDIAAEQVAALAVAADRVTTDTEVSEVAVDGDADAVGGTTSIGGETIEVGIASAESEQAIDITDGAVDGDGADGPSGEGADAATTDTAPGSDPATDGAAAGDGADVAPVVQQVTNPVARTAETGGNQVSGSEAISGPGAISNRTTTTAATTTAAQNAEAPVAEGEASDRLWLQVRRAMGSLRNLRNGDQQLTIRLRPAELGSVVVRVNAGEHGTRVSLLTDSAVAANQLGQQRQQLVSELEQGGLSGVAVDISNGGQTGDPGTSAQGGDRSGDRSVDGTITGAATGATAALAGATTATVPRTGGRGRRPGGESGGLVDVDL